MTEEARHAARLFLDGAEFLEGDVEASVGDILDLFLDKAGFRDLVGVARFSEAVAEA